MRVLNHMIVMNFSVCPVHEVLSSAYAYFPILGDAAKQLAEIKFKLQEAERENNNHQANVSSI